ncbi:MAG: hypothetical protein JXR19_04930 [Bacteroidia bacterium]
MPNYHSPPLLRVLYETDSGVNVLERDSIEIQDFTVKYYNNSMQSDVDSPFYWIQMDAIYGRILNIYPSDAWENGESFTLIRFNNLTDDLVCKYFEKDDTGYRYQFLYNGTKLNSDSINRVIRR